MIRIDRLDHLVLTVRSIDATCAFYAEALGMQVQTADGGRKALRFGEQTINLHESGREAEPGAFRPTPGSADICLLAETPPDAVIAHLRRCGIAIEAGPVQRAGAVAGIVSVYVRDPDRNLVEVSAVVHAGRDVPARSEQALPSTALGAGAAGALALGAAALGAFAVGAFAVGALAIGRIAVGKAHVRRLEIDELVIRDIGTDG